jgi:hypothetical protein
MLIFSLALIFMGGAVILIGGVWTLVLAFTRAWGEMKTPLLLLLAGLALAGGGGYLLSPTASAPILAAMKNRQNPSLALAAALKGQPPTAPSAIAATTAPSEARDFVDHSPFGAQKRAELQLRLISLRQKEATLLERKAELDPNDSAGTAKLAEEINRYNAELKPVTDEIQAHPDWKLE